MTRVRLAWGITGAGDYLSESLSIVKKISRGLDVEVTVLLSKSGELVVKWYRLWDELQASFKKVKVEKGPNAPFVAGPLQVGYYRLFFVSPATANTVAKIAYGIADTLITNCVAQAIKGGTPVYIYPVDQELGSRETQIPNGNMITIRTRRVDVENVERLKGMEGITVLKHPFDIEQIVASIVSQEVG
ncbi:MAG: archaeoflavoprotein AfpA [Anaerolineae bacterium]|jgi:archaeoflavoprotein AfpA|nr:archaeoflavoprotein AfpA [Anaerolineae bacterium]MDH7474335.1 archaeoflavoprotein AfpA [Anaerolineae bacterium]